MLQVQKKQIHDLLANVSGIPGNRVIWSYQNGIRPPLPFIMLTESGDAPAAGEVISTTPEPGVLSVRTPYQCNLTLEYFTNANDGGVDALAHIVQQLSAPSIVDTLFSAGMCIYETGPVNDISTVLDNLAYERRASVDLSIRYDRAITDDVGYIAQVDISDTFGDMPQHDFSINTEGETNNGES